MTIDANLLEGIKLGILIGFVIAMPFTILVGISTYKKGVQDGKNA